MSGIKTDIALSNGRIIKTKLANCGIATVVYAEDGLFFSSAEWEEYSQKLKFIEQIEAIPLSEDLKS